eukprot:Skav227177  [mRNA]  locus=scaffold1396:139548:146739:+ [translate_table: standard]
MSLFGPWAGLARLTTVNDVVTFFNVPGEAWTAFENQVGDFQGDLRFLASLPRAGLLGGISLAQLPDGSKILPVTATQIGLVWRLAKRVMAFQGGINENDFVDVDPWDEPGSSSGNQAAVSTSPSGVKDKVLKMSSLIDQGDDSELLPPSSSDISKWLQQYLAVMGSMPEESEEPSPNQLAGLAKRVFKDDLAPYTDFAVFGPYERKLSRSHKCRIFTPLGDGSFLQRELPGPPTYQSWVASWRVYKTACLMLGVLSISALEIYARTIEKLNTQWPSCWGLIYAADDALRAERFDKLRRHFIAESAFGRQVPRDWDPVHPWSCVMIYAARDDTYWSEKVHIPASAWVAAGSKGKPAVATEAAVRANVPGLQDASDGVGTITADQRDAKRQANRDRRVVRRQKFKQDLLELRAYRDMKVIQRGFDKTAKGGGKGSSRTTECNPSSYPFPPVPPGGVAVKETKEKPSKPVTCKPQVPEQFWVVSNARKGRVSHRVRDASWNLDLSRWTTWCGWHFAERNVKVSLSPKLLQGTVKCKKCEQAKEVRDDVNRGVSLAQIMALPKGSGK